VELARKEEAKDEDLDLLKGSLERYEKGSGKGSSSEKSGEKGEKEKE
jgi:hypothetical protein